jgi:ssDNA thymidine ADP-ribosyltransferase, DarT
MNNPISQLIIEKKITRLCHFTNSRSFLHIIPNPNGIIASNFLNEDEREEFYKQNDELRLDGKLDYISCSIQYPNTWYLNRIKNKDPNFVDWLILFLDPYLMLDKNTLFCHRNAAANNGQYLKPGVQGFKGMFERRVQGQYLMTRTPNMLSCCPTDGQAEVMIYRNIPIEHIKGICVPNSEKADHEKLKLKLVGVPEEQIRSFDWVVAPDLFNPGWNTLIKNGFVPEEIIL